MDTSTQQYWICNSVFSEKKLSQSLSHTHLGIHFQSDGHWNKHIHTIHDKAARILNLLSMLKYNINRKSLVIKYNAWISPVLKYGDIVLDNCSITDSKILENLQVEAARIITGLRHNSSQSKLCDELEWDLLCTRRLIHKFILLYKIIINGFCTTIFMWPTWNFLPKKSPIQLKK